MKYKCPCCGFYTLDEPAKGNYNICPVCFWEDDGVQNENPDCPGGANHISLNQAKENYLNYGACEEKFVKNVRRPFKKEMPDAVSRKKRIYIGGFIAFVTAVVFLFFLLFNHNYSYIEDFDELENDYTAMAELAFECYNEYNPGNDEFLILVIYDDHLKLSNAKVNGIVQENYEILLSSEQMNSMERIQSLSYFTYSYMWVSSDYVVFWQDETKKYGVLYSNHPKVIIHGFRKDWYMGMQYHKINNKWYEIGFFGR